jgi:pretoxin HINT domain-containing protein
MTWPQFDQQPPQQQPAPPSPARPWWRRGWVVFGSIMLVVALVTGLATSLVWSSPANRDPFDKAVTNLAAAPGLHYRNPVESGSIRWDARVTSHGEVIGSIEQAGQKVDMLAVGGKTYLKAPDGLLPGTSTHTTPLRGKWITGDSALFGPLLSQALSPATLAGTLRHALDETTRFPTTDAPSTINGTPALKASTPSGDLYVSQDAPYRVLRYVPSGHTPELPPLPRPGTRSLPQIPSTPSLLDPGRQWRLSQPGFGEMDIDPMSAPEVDKTYNDLEDNAKQLTNVINSSTNFQLKGKADISCGAGGCTVTATVTNTNTASAGAGATLTGQVTAEMTATVSINGLPAGGCTQVSPLPLNGTGSISCTDPEAGPVFTEANAIAEAKAKATATPGSTYRWTVYSYAPVVVLARAQVNVEKLIEDLRLKRQDAACSETPNSFVTGTPVLMADGSSRPIEQITPGDRVLATDPSIGQTAAEPVLARIIGRGSRQLDAITIVHNGRNGTLTATSNHPFWDPDQHTWIDAGALRVGGHLNSHNGDAVLVTAVHPFTQTATVYNLTIADLHTYHVKTAGTAVLVHNPTGDDGCGDKAANHVAKQKLLKQIPDASKLDALIAKAGDAAKLERLLKVFPESELETIFAHLTDSRRLVIMLDHVGADTGAGMIQQWMGKGKFAEMNQFMERLAGGMGKELAERAALGGKSLIIDSNTAIALMKDADPALRGTMDAGHRARVAYIKSLPAGTELRAGNVTIGEIGSGVVNIKGLPIEVSRESAEYQKLLKTLATENVGKGKGFADRGLIADAFFAKTEQGVARRLLTADQQAVKSLASMATPKIDVLRSGGYDELVKKYGASGFNVTIEGRTLTVIPVP